ncbi:helix-turn-helix domain-containing protein [Rhizobium sp. NRK18]|uniref:helix-turn-helix domain-containing protein n=1 Tax=Rhizobium sp. NRK18 TaxID=2964667 RepID=UPI0021C3FE74|nr:helix-turn-helix domain-containing protein [Rhizobium sp. NRK18]MCQ2006115.1 helix-turn-helix domain-containing protein [Rhizobium sp. NRK18]
MSDAENSIREIGQRLKAFRIGAGLTPEDLANQIGISRAAIYRYEAGATPKVDTLVMIADKLGVTLPNLLGIGTEYIPNAVGFFERMRQLEEQVDQIQVLFGPVSYLLTTDLYDEFLKEVLEESVPLDAPFREKSLGEIKTLIGILQQRKETYRHRKPAVLSLISAAELEQFVRVGFVGAYGLSNIDIAKRRRVALNEVENIVRMLRDQPIGTQIGLVVDSIPGSSFQLFRSGTHRTLAVSPFRLGAFPNVRIGVASVSSAPEAVSLHASMTESLWRRSMKGEDAIRILEDNIITPYK